MKTIKINNLREIRNPLPSNILGNVYLCLWCNGSGQYLDYNYYIGYLTRKCTKCNGKGVVQ